MKYEFTRLDSNASLEEKISSMKCCSNPTLEQVESMYLHSVNGLLPLPNQLSVASDIVADWSTDAIFKDTDSNNRIAWNEEVKFSQVPAFNPINWLYPRSIYGSFKKSVIEKFDMTTSVIELLSAVGIQIPSYMTIQVIGDVDTTYVKYNAYGTNYRGKWMIELLFQPGILLHYMHDSLIVPSLSAASEKQIVYPNWMCAIPSTDFKIRQMNHGEVVSYSDFPSVNSSDGNTWRYVTDTRTGTSGWILESSIAEFNPVYAKRHVTYSDELAKTIIYQNSNGLFIHETYATVTWMMSTFAEGAQAYHLFLLNEQCSSGD